MNHCQRCGSPIPEGGLKYQVAVQVRSLFDGAIPESEHDPDGQKLERLLKEVAGYSEEELNRQVYEDDIFIMCPECKEAFMEDIYAHLTTKSSPEFGRAHLIQ